MPDLMLKNLVALTGIERANRQFSSVQLGLSSCVFGPVGMPPRGLESGSSGSSPTRKMAARAILVNPQNPQLWSTDAGRRPAPPRGRTIPSAGTPAIVGETCVSSSVTSFLVKLL
jgi:hypothetical protein